MVFPVRWRSISKVADLRKPGADMLKPGIEERPPLREAVLGLDMQ
jgi:hypothetical protein